MNSNGQSLRPLVGWLVVIAAVAALRETRWVTMPLGVAMVLVALAWPFQRRLEARLPRGLSLGITLLVILAVLALFVGSLLLCVNAIASEASAYEARFADAMAKLVTWLEGRGVHLRFEQFEPYQAMERAVALAGRLAKGTYDFLGALILIAVYLFLALIELPGFQRKLQAGGASPLGRRMAEALGEAGASVQRFVLARTVVGLAIGLLTAVYCWIIGLDFALVWGVIGFLLNYILIFGAVIAVIPPTLLALIQPEAAWLAPATLFGLAGIHVVLGNYVDPWVQGRFLALSPLALLFSITFWGWVWGIPGALISVPLTATVVIVCRRFESTQWVARMLVDATWHFRSEGVRRCEAPLEPAGLEQAAAKGSPAGSKG
jgi:predicted PurR-regulated permease PerM